MKKKEKYDKNEMLKQAYREAVKKLEDAERDFEQCDESFFHVANAELTAAQLRLSHIISIFRE